MRKGLLGFGIALIVFSVVVTPIAYFISMGELNKLDPEKDDDTIRISSNGEIKTILKGKYDIWYEDDPGDLVILGPNDEPIDIEKDPTIFPVEGKKRYGVVDLENSGLYTFNYDGGTLFITPSVDTSFYDNIILACLLLGLFMIIAGIALVIVGAIMKPKFSILDYRREQMRRGGPPSRRRPPSQPVQKGDLEPKKKK
ncbi:MAG: hypothetical protein ACMUIG_09755 [Thermoplasmatota archaeon]